MIHNPKASKIQVEIIKRWRGCRYMLGDLVWIGPAAVEVWVRTGRAKVVQQVQSPRRRRMVPSETKPVMPAETKPAGPTEPIERVRTNSKPVCQYCGKECRTMAGLMAHIRFCPEKDDD